MKADLFAGLSAAAVVIPKAMAYATIAGLPVQVGLYTVIVPMVVYAVLGSSRPLSVSTTTTIAILTGAELGRVAPGGGAAELIAAAGTLGPGGRAPVRGERVAPRLHRQFHLGIGAHRLQGGHRRGDRARPAAEAHWRAYP